MKMKSEAMSIPKDTGKSGPKFEEAAKGGSLGMGLAHQEKKVDVSGAQPSEIAQRMPKDSARI